MLLLKSEKKHGYVVIPGVCLNASIKITLYVISKMNRFVSSKDFLTKCLTEISVLEENGHNGNVT